MTYEETRIVVVLFGFVAILAIFAGVAVWATRGSDEIETFMDELEEERAQRRRY
ncbi:hypothetical protein [Ralstonia mannitolilytica]|uniref:Transmembrane protein n=1 Tax=Ralstonia pickettii (strain 12D) TaxID=428406 RepID=C6BBV3_RALP1|nr:hypothetical protein [Ralstonia mannitolilytica]